MNTDIDLRNCLLSNFCNLIPVHLDGSNYVTWKFLLETMLRGCGLMKYVDGSFPCPSQYMITEEGGVLSKMTAEYLTWKQNDYAVMTLLAATLSSGVLSFVVGSNTSREIWCLLKERYACTSWFNKEQLKSNFYKLQKGSDSIDNYLDRVKIACDQLANVGIHMSDDDIIVSVLLGLPSDYTTMKTIIRAKHNPVSTQELRSLLLIAEAELEEANKSISLPSETEFVTHDDSCRSNGGMHQQYGTHMPQMQTNSNLLQQATPSTFTPSLATYGGISQVHNASFPQNSSFLQQPSFSQLSAPYCSTTQQYVYGCFSQPTSFIAKSGAHRSCAKGIRNGAKSGVGQNLYEKRSETLVGMDSTLPLQIDQAMMDKAEKNDELVVNVILAAKTGNEDNVINSRKGKMRKGEGLSQQGYSSSIMCQLCKKTGHSASRCYHRNSQPQNTHSSNSFNVKCQICYSFGHTAPTCLQRSAPRQIVSSGASMTCQICLMAGHSAAECFHRHHYAFHSPTSATPQSIAAASSSQSMPLSLMLNQFFGHPLSHDNAFQLLPLIPPG